MHIPRAWTKCSTNERTPDGQNVTIAVWGWGDDLDAARSNASQRMARLADRIRRGEPFPDRYAYADRPLREEILKTIPDVDPQSPRPAAVITRNNYGAIILNAQALLFLDIDIQQSAGVLNRIFGRKPNEDDLAMSRLRQTLEQLEIATFRVYRTASGLRAMAVDRTFDPGSNDVQQLMKATGTDPAFAHLCRIQKSFRARLTPKPWRCRCTPPPGRYPRDDADQKNLFDQWLSEYESATARFATCRYLETIGSASPLPAHQPLIELHDLLTRSAQPLPLA